MHKLFKLENFALTLLTTKFYNSKHGSLQEAKTDLDPTNHVLSLSKFVYLKDHKILGRAIVPFSFYVEMICSDIAHWNCIPKVTIQNMRVYQSVSFDDGNTILQVKYESKKNGQYVVNILKQDSTMIGNESVIATALLCSGETTEVDTGNIREQYNAADKSIKNIRDLYALFRNCGLEYGNRFKLIQQLRCNSSVGKSTLRLQNDQPNDLSSPFIHPTLLDAGFQTIGGVCLDDKVKNCFVPISVDSIQLYGNLHGEIICYVALQEYSRSSRIINANLIYIDKSTSKIIAKIDHLKLIKVRRLKP